MKKMEKNEPEKLDMLLTSHFVTKFMFDVLQFSYAYFVIAEPDFTEEPNKYQLYDHRKPVLRDVDGK